MTLKVAPAKSRGFTLIELMITVAIIGILASVAFPSYTSYILRAKRTECRSAITQAMQQQERTYTQTNAYLAYTASTTLLTFSGENLGASACTISAEACAGGVSLASCVLVRGTPLYTDAEVNQITMRSDGIKSCTGSNTAKCWK